MISSYNIFPLPIKNEMKGQLLDQLFLVACTFLCYQIHKKSLNANKINGVFLKKKKETQSQLLLYLCCQEIVISTLAFPARR